MWVSMGRIKNSWFALSRLSRAFPLCLSLYVCTYPDTWGLCCCGKATQMQQKSKGGHCRKALKLHKHWFYQCWIYLTFQYKGQVKNCSFINFFRKGQTKLKRSWFRSIENPVILVCNFLLKANDQLPLLCPCCYLWSADPLFLVTRVMVFNSCPVCRSSFLLSALLCGVGHCNEPASGNHIKVPAVELDVQCDCNLGNKC